MEILSVRGGGYPEKQSKTKEGIHMEQNIFVGFTLAAGIVITLYFTVKWAVKKGIEEACDVLIQKNSAPQEGPPEEAGAE